MYTYVTITSNLLSYTRSISQNGNSNTRYFDTGIYEDNDDFFAEHTKLFLYDIICVYFFFHVVRPSTVNSHDVLPIII